MLSYTWIILTYFCFWHSKMYQVSYCDNVKAKRGPASGFSRETNPAAFTLTHYLACEQPFKQQQTTRTKSLRSPCMHIQIHSQRSFQNRVLNAINLINLTTTKSSEKITWTAINYYLTRYFPWFWTLLLNTSSFTWFERRDWLWHGSATLYAYTTFVVWKKWRCFISEKKSDNCAVRYLPKKRSPPFFCDSASFTLITKHIWPYVSAAENCIGLSMKISIGRPLN